MEAIILAASEPIAPARIAAVLPACNPVAGARDRRRAQRGVRRAAARVRDLGGRGRLPDALAARVRAVPAPDADDAAAAPLVRRARDAGGDRLSPARHARGDRAHPRRRRGRGAAQPARPPARAHRGTPRGAGPADRLRARRGASSRCSGSRSSAICPTLRAIEALPEAPERASPRRHRSRRAAPSPTRSSDADRAISTKISATTTAMTSRRRLAH